MRQDIAILFGVVFSDPIDPAEDGHVYNWYPDTDFQTIKYYEPQQGEECGKMPSYSCLHILRNRVWKWTLLMLSRRRLCYEISGISHYFLNNRYGS